MTDLKLCKYLGLDFSVHPPHKHIQLWTLTPIVKLPIVQQCKTSLNTHPHRTDCLKYPVYFVIPVSCIFLIHLLLCVYNQRRTVDRALAGNAFMYISHTQNLATGNIQSRGQQVSATAPCTLLLCIANLTLLWCSRCSNQNAFGAGSAEPVFRHSL